jgi:hypothetical protein
MRERVFMLQGFLIIFSFVHFTSAFIARGSIRRPSRQALHTFLYSSMTNTTTSPATGVPMEIDDAFDTNTLSGSLFGLVRSFTDNLPPPTLNDASTSLEQMITSTVNKELLTFSTVECAQQRLTNRAVLAAMAMCHNHAATNTNLNKKDSWKRLQAAGARLQSQLPSESNALSIASVFCCLALMRSDAAKAAASAVSSTVSGNKPLRHAGHNIASQVLRSLLVHAASSDALNLNTLVQFAKAFDLDDDNGQHSELSANVIRYALSLDQSDNVVGPEKQAVNGALALACQVHPWLVLPPVILVEAALPFDFWQAAEQVCMSAHEAAALKSSTAIVDTKDDSAMTESVAAVETLINAAMEAKTYRRADKIATNLYDAGGKARYVEARLCHACDTIAKVVFKRKMPIIERQVERVDRAVAKASDTLGASAAVRKFALQQLEEAGEIDAAHRLATLWNLDHVYDEEAILAAADARRKKYIQWDDVLPGSIPDLVSTPHDLISAFEQFRKGQHQFGPFGLDAEWDEDSNGVAVLQLAHSHMAVLIDVPALSATIEGVAALEQTVGLLLGCSRSVVVGFACRQDLSRLRASPSIGNRRWLSGTGAVVDAQRFVAEAEPTLGRLGLSRICEHYLGKPLDKAEQCSLWTRRPLLEKQRVYASLDAWVCVAIHQKLFPSWSPPPNGA